jgi:nucleoside-diphosphate-sugar epimerase
VARIVIAGCGYIGGRLARLWREQGATVTCLVRSPEKAAQLADEGFSARAISLDGEIASLPEVKGATLYYFVPPPGGGIADSRARRFIAMLIETGAPERIVYMSATSVYSEGGGAVVTEQSPVEPESAMGKRRRDAEVAFQEYGATHGVPVVILRVSGIYGPGRLPLMQISQGQPLLREEESGPSNRIHADDLAALCVAAADKGADGDIFNISDGQPSSMTAYFNACADALGCPRQPQVTMTEAREVMTPLMFSYVSQSRVVDNSLMCHTLGVALRYGDLMAGIAASVAENKPD